MRDLKKTIWKECVFYDVFSHVCGLFKLWERKILLADNGKAKQNTATFLLYPFELKTFVIDLKCLEMLVSLKSRSVL